MIPLDKLSRSHFDIYEIPDASSRICNTKSLRLTLVHITLQHFIPTWDEVDFQKIEALSCVQFARKHKAQPFNFYTNYVEVIFVFLFPLFLTLCQVGTKLFIPSWDEVVSNHWRFCYLWANCPQDFPTNCWEVDCHTSHK